MYDQYHSQKHNKAWSVQSSQTSSLNQHVLHLKFKRPSVGKLVYRKSLSKNQFQPVHNIDTLKRFSNNNDSESNLKLKKYGKIYENKLSVQSTLKTQLYQTLKQTDERQYLSSLDWQLKERDYVSQICQLEAKCLELERILGSKLSASKSQSEFLNLNRTLYKQMFDIKGLKQIWSKHKFILQQWMFLKQSTYNPEQHITNKIVQSKQKTKQFFPTRANPSYKNLTNTNMNYK